MKLSTRTSITLTTCGLIGWGALYGLFFWSSTEYGNYPDVSVGQIRGASVERFRLAPDEVLLTSRKGGVDNNEVLMLTNAPLKESSVVYIVKDQNTLLFEQRVQNGFDSVAWNTTKEYFVVENKHTGEELVVFLDDDGQYMITSGE